MDRISAFAPATIANFNVGFDILGLSLGSIGDEVYLTKNNTTKNQIIGIQNGESLPKEPEKNCCSVVIRAIQEYLGEYIGIDIFIKKGFASGSGMGSSSASSAAAAYAYNALVGSPLTTQELIPFAAKGEKIACGTAHIDNVAPSILGGLVLATGSTPDDIIPLPILPNLYAITVFPQVELKTSDSRKVLVPSVPLAVCSQQIGLMGAFVSSLYENDISRFKKSMQDLIVEPSRKDLIPNFDEAKKVSISNDALAFGISGSGPTVFAIARGKQQAEHLQKELKSVYQKNDVSIVSSKHLLEANNGARIL